MVENIIGLVKVQRIPRHTLSIFGIQSIATWIHMVSFNRTQNMPWKLPDAQEVTTSGGLALRFDF